MAKTNKFHAAKNALIVHSDMNVIAALQAELTKSGITAIVARDLPTTLLAITQHFFEVAVVSSKISETGDGWPVAGVLRLVFPRIFLVMIVPGTDVLTLRSAINNGVDEVLEQGSTPEAIAKTLLRTAAPSVPPGTRVQ